MSAVLIAAATSGAGKTTVTLGLLRALVRSGTPVQSVKLGPDYIDPAFHAAATGRPAVNLDPWAMPLSMQKALLTRQGNEAIVVESAMGLFDGAGLSGSGCAADVAAAFDLPILLVVDCARAAHTIPALVEGLVNHRSGLRFHGLVLNNVGSPRHEALLRAAFDRSQSPPVLAALARQPNISLPSRHLGLVQALEHPELDPLLDRLAGSLERVCDPAALVPTWSKTHVMPAAVSPPGQRIAIAQDAAFSFVYAHQLNEWRSAGAELSFFSPLENERVPEADFIYLPGGYPELYAGQLANAEKFMQSLRIRAEISDIYGECGGYMVLGEHLIDAKGTSHPMAGLLNVVTSFESRKLHLGYRSLETHHSPLAGVWRGHEFHYSSIVCENGEPLFFANDADGATLPAMGLRSGRVCGSYAHLIARYR